MCRTFSFDCSTTGTAYVNVSCRLLPFHTYIKTRIRGNTLMNKVLFYLSAMHELNGNRMFNFPFVDERNYFITFLRRKRPPRTLHTHSRTHSYIARNVLMLIKLHNSYAVTSPTVYEIADPSVNYYSFDIEIIYLLH